MCGITGFNWEDKKLVKEMTDIIRYRGPDQYDYYTDSLVSLGHRRLNIIDLSERGKQPMCNEFGSIWIVYNGEIYNFWEIRINLEKNGHIFKSNTDTEVIIHAYEEYGLDCVKLFNGMFAFAIWDSRKKKIILARDRLGVKPLFYYFDKARNKLAFASEIKSLLQNYEIKKEMNKDALNQLIHYAHTVDGETLLKGISELMPGHLLVYDFKNIEIKKYWDLKINVWENSEDFFAKRLRDMLKESVKKRLVADVPLGASLSGGIDSSSIVYFMSQFSDKPVKTFTVGFNDDSDELKEAREVAEFCKTDHHEILVDFKDISKELPKILWHAEVPFGKPAMLATYFLSKEINRKKVTIDLSGEGSDEVFAGYNRSGIFLKDSLPNKEKINGIISGYFSENEKEFFFDKNIIPELKPETKPESIFLPNLEKINVKEQLNAALHFEIKNQLPGIQLSRADRMSMAHSHEIRSPFVDYELMEFGMTIPSRLKWNGNNKKYVLQKAMKGLLPDSIVNRIKIPFHMPLLKYFHEDFTDMAQGILSNSSISRIGLANRDKILSQIKRVKNKDDKEDNSLRQILFLTTLEFFYKIFVEKDKINEKDLDIGSFL